MSSLVLKLKASEAALTTNNTVSNSITTCSSGRLARLFNSNSSTVFVATLASANSANLNQTTIYGTISVPAATEVFISKAATDTIVGNAAILATSVAIIG